MTYAQATPQDAAYTACSALDTRLHIRRMGVVGLLLVGLCCASQTFAEPLLRCDVTYAGHTHVVQASPVSDPYSVPSVDIAGRFRFKPVMVGDATRLSYIKLYAYVVAADEQPKLIHESKYQPPDRWMDAPVPLTGTQHLYAGPLERELIYSCTLQGGQP